MAYNSEQTFYIRNIYEQCPRPETIAQLARELGKTEKSLIAKLCTMGLYKKAPYKTKRGENPIAKNALAGTLAGMLSALSDADKKSLARINKGVLQLLIARLQK